MQHLADTPGRPRAGSIARRAAAVALAVAFWSVGAANARANPAPWIVLSDIHFDPRSHSPYTSWPGEDTNPLLLRSAIAEMHRVDAAAPVVVITGDFLAHRFDFHDAEPTMRQLARDFDRAFPHAQFVIALGNEDSGCTDYALAANAPFLRAVAAAWGPLVNRNGAAPHFGQTFIADGFYVARLPIAGLRAVVIDNVFWSPRYRTACGGRDAGSQTWSELQSALRDHGAGPAWVIAHIPPGIDAFSTVHLTHRLLDVPLLDPEPRERWMALVNDPRAHVTAVLAAHIHKFAFRFDGGAGPNPVPIVLVPSVSPVFANSPSFLTVDVRPDGVIGRETDHALIDGRWRIVGGTDTLGLASVTGRSLRDLQTRLAHDPALRARYAALYNGGARPEIDERNWRAYWCATSDFTAGAFQRCLGSWGGLGPLTRRGVSLLVLALLAACIVVAAVVFATRKIVAGRRHRRAR